MRGQRSRREIHPHRWRSLPQKRPIRLHWQRSWRLRLRLLLPQFNPFYQYVDFIL
jgi:hypothetical protein